MNYNKKVKKSKDKLELYARDGDTLYDVSKFQNIVDVLIGSMPVVLDMIKSETLPLKIFVEYEDLVELNKMIFGIERGLYFKLYLSAQRNAKPILQFEDVKLADAKDLYKISKASPNNLKVIN